jgi:hypothetical protein
MTTAHLLLIDQHGPALVIHEDTPASERADAIVAVEAFTAGDDGDDLLRHGVYRFYVDPETGNGMVGGRVDL